MKKDDVCGCCGKRIERPSTTEPLNDLDRFWSTDAAELIAQVRAELEQPPSETGRLSPSSPDERTRR